MKNTKKLNKIFNEGTDFEYTYFCGIKGCIDFKNEIVSKAYANFVLNKGNKSLDFFIEESKDLIALKMIKI